MERDFTFTEELIDRLIYGMENQGERYIFDMHRCDILSRNDMEGEMDDVRYIEIPQWDSAKGFQLMEKFVVTLRNPLYRQRLQEVLTGGKGVFRKFKDVLNEREDIERLWFNFKEREMRRLVKEWYEQTCECLGLEMLGEEPEELDDLILSDFIIREGEERDIGFLLKNDREAFNDIFPDEDEKYISEMYRTRRKEYTPGIDGANLVYCLETPAGETVGFIWGVGKEGFLRILQLFIERKYRGLGLAKLLLGTFLNRAQNEKVDRVLFELPGVAMNVASYLEREGFTVHSEILSLSLKM